MRKSGMSFKSLWKSFASTMLMASAILLIVSTNFALAAAGGGHGGWAATDWYRTMNFGLLFIALFFLLRKPIAKALNARSNSIRDQLAELEAKKKQAEAELASYKDKLASLDREAEEIVAQYIKQGEAAKAKILKEAEAAAEKLEAQAKRNIAHEFKQAEVKLRDEILEKALAQAEAHIRSNITTEDQNRLVDEYLNKVVA